MNTAHKHREPIILAKGFKPIDPLVLTRKDGSEVVVYAQHRTFDTLFATHYWYYEGSSDRFIAADYIGTYLGTIHRSPTTREAKRMDKELRSITQTR